MKRMDRRRTGRYTTQNDKVIMLYASCGRGMAQTTVSRQHTCRSGRRVPVFVSALLAVLIVLGGMVVHGNVISANAVPQEKIYTSVQIEAGDSLWSIAAEYCEDTADIQDYIEDLKSMNGIANEKGLQAGGYLTVYYYQE